MKFKKVDFFVLVILIFFTFIVVTFAFTCSKNYNYKQTAIKYCNYYGVDKNLVFAIIKTESNYNENAVSKKGAIGLMQILPSTAEYISEKLGYSKVINLFDSETNVEFGVYYLKYLIDKYASEDVAICAYNAGEGVILKWGLNNNFSQQKIKYKETLNYYKKVIFYKKLYGILSYD